MANMASNPDALRNYTTPGYPNGVEASGPYQVPDIVLNSPFTRKIRVLSIGAGLSGIMNSYYVQKELQNIELVVYDKNHDIGGTWLENRYPGCACDVASHAYTFLFALNPDWPKFYSPSTDIWAYLNKVVETFNLRRFMHFNCKIVGAYWQDETGEWLVKIEETLPNGTKRLFEDRCHMFLHGTGALNNYKWPSLKGMDKFKGKIIHTANWPTDYEAEQWKDERVVVIGSGASSVQVVPKMQPHVEHMDIFIRTGVWFVALVDNVGANHEYTQEEKDEFRSDPSKLVAHAKKMDAGLNGLWGIFYRDSEKQAAARKAFGERMARIIKDERLLKGFTPTFGVGCRRVTPGDPYMLAIQEPNVTVNFTAVTEFTENGVIGGDGIERECDTIVCATGFDVSYRPRFPIVGKNGIDLVDKWKVCPEGYMGLMVPGFPNFVTFIGPNWPIQNGSAVGPLTAVTEYALQLIRRLQTGYVLGMSPRQDVTDEFNEHCQEWIKHTVWVDDCRSWYKNNETGRVNAVWPGSSVHYMDALKTPRYEDFEIDYFGPGKINRFAYLGMGTDKTLAEDGDTTYYFTHEKIDPEWQKAVGMPVTNSTTLA